MLDRLTRDQANAVYDILIEECGATDPRGHERVSFAYYMMDERSFKEFRFQGSLGFGGKCRLNGNYPVPYVDCYREDQTTERLVMILRANERIAALFNAEVTQ